MVDFTLENIITMISDSFFGGNTTITGLVLMLACFFFMLVILARVKAPPVYAIVPMIPLGLAFMSMGMINTEVSMLLVIISVVVVAMYGRKLVGGDE